MAKNARAVVVDAFNAQAPASAARLVSKPVRDPGPGEVLVRMRLAGVNPSDVFSLMGVYPGFSKLGGTPGFDGMGVIESLGEGVTGMAPGDRVTSLGWDATTGGEGSWQELVVLPAERVVRLPDAVSDEAGAQFYINPVTVVGLLEVAAVQPGQHLLITAAGSTLGRMLICTARAAGIKTIGVVRRAEAAEELKAATGCDEVVCSTTESLVQRVKELTGGSGAAAVLDCVGGQLSEQLGAAVRTGGTVWTYGLMDGLTFTGSGVDAIFRDVAYRGFWLVPWLEAKPASEQRAVVEKTVKLLADKVMDPPVGKVFPLADFAAAVEESQQTGRIGKVLLKMD